MRIHDNDLTELSPSSKAQVEIIDSMLNVWTTHCVAKVKSRPKKERAAVSVCSLILC